MDQETRRNITALAFISVMYSIFFAFSLGIYFRHLFTVLDRLSSSDLYGTSGSLQLHPYISKISPSYVVFGVLISIATWVGFFVAYWFRWLWSLRATQLIHHRVMIPMKGLLYVGIMGVLLLVLMLTLKVLLGIQLSSAGWYSLFLLFVWFVVIYESLYFVNLEQGFQLLKKQILKEKEEE